MSLKELSEIKNKPKYEIFNYIEFENIGKEIKEGVIIGIIWKIEHKEFWYNITIENGYVWLIKEKKIKNIKEL